EAYTDLAWIKSELGFKSEALQAYLQARDIREKLVDVYSAEIRFKSRLADNHNQVGAMQLETGKLSEALQSYEKARDLLEELTDANPTNKDLWCNLAL